MVAHENARRERVELVATGSLLEVSHATSHVNLALQKQWKQPFWPVQEGWGLGPVGGDRGGLGHGGLGTMWWVL